MSGEYRCGEAWDISTTIDGERCVTDGAPRTMRRVWQAPLFHVGFVLLLLALFIMLGILVRSGRTLAFDERVHRLVRGHVPTEFEEDDTSLRTRFMHLGPDIGTATILFVPLTALVLW